MSKFAISLKTAVTEITAVAVEPAAAGPGGFIAKAAYETFWGKVLVLE